MEDQHQSVVLDVVPAASLSEAQIGDSRPLYKICSQCRESKFYQSFPLKGGISLYKRRRYCNDCAEDIVSPATHYNFDVSMLDDCKYGFIYFISPKGRNEITLQDAIRFVSLGKARIRTPFHIVQLTNPEPFVKYVLERDAHRCQQCGKRGTEAVRLREPDAIKCFCIECATISSAAQAPQRGPEQILYTPPPHGELHVYCDGSVSNSRYGCGVVLISASKGMTHYERSRCDKRGHSFYAELMAISSALRSIYDYLSHDINNVTSVTVFTDVAHMETFLGKHTNRRQDVYITKVVQEINLLLGNLKIAFPEMLVSIKYIGPTQNQFHHLAHRLSRCYKGKVSTVKLHPISPPRKRIVYPQEFRLQVVTDARRAGSLTITARKLGIAVSTLYRWRQQLDGGKIIR